MKTAEQTQAQKRSHSSNDHNPVKTEIPLTQKLVAALTKRPRTFKATMEWPATWTETGVRYHVALDAAETAEMYELADAFDMSLEAFLRLFLSICVPNPAQRRRLPGQIERSKKRTRRTETAPARFECSDPDTLRRIERAAFFYGQTVERFVMETLAAELDLLEEHWIVNPRTKEPLAGTVDVEAMLDRGKEWIETLQTQAIRRDVAAAVAEGRPLPVPIPAPPPAVLAGATVAVAVS